MTYHSHSHSIAEPVRLIYGFKRKPMHATWVYSYYLFFFSFCSYHIFSSPSFSSYFNYYCYYWRSFFLSFLLLLMLYKRRYVPKITIHCKKFSLTGVVHPYLCCSQHFKILITFYTSGNLTPLDNRFGIQFFHQKFLDKIMYPIFLLDVETIMKDQTYFKNCI